MRDPPTTCPGPAVLEALASGGVTPDAVVCHVARCDACAEYLRSARFSRRFAEIMSERASPGDSSRASLPDVFGYRVIEEIARGGQGVIYRAEQLTTGQVVAIKVLHASGAGESCRDARARFLREIQIIASLQAPGIVRVLDALKLIDGRDALVMELIDGVPLHAWSRQRPSPDEPRKLELLACISDALHYAHQRGVTHRDMKPSNILVDAEDRPYLLDFGIARRMDGGGLLDRITMTGAFTGTLAYAAPEQVSREASAPDVRTDIYALGVIAFELLTGRPPYAVDGSLESTVRHILTSGPPDRADSGQRTDVWCVLCRAMAKEPARRYPSASDLARDLRAAAAGEAIDARHDSRWYVLRKAAGRHRLAVAFAATLLLGMGSVALILAASNARLGNALSESRLSQIRAHLSAGQRDRAERILWPEIDRLLATGVDPVDALRDGDFAKRRLMWRFLELQAAGVCLQADRLETSYNAKLQRTADGLVGVTASDGRVSLLDPGKGSRVGIGRVATDPSRDTVWLTHDERRVIAMSVDEVRVIEIASGEVLAARRVSSGERTADVILAYDRLALSLPNGSLLVLSLPTLEDRFIRDDLLPGQLAWLSPDGGRVAFLDRDARLRFVDLMSGHETVFRGDPVFINPPVDFLPQILVTPDGRQVLVSHRDGVEVLTWVGDEITRRVTIATGYLTRLTIDPTGRFLAGNAYGDGQLRLWDARTWRELPSLSGHAGAVRSVTFSADGERVVTIDSDSVLRTWATPGTLWRRRYGAPTSATHQLAVSPDDSTLYAFDHAGRLSGLDVEGVGVGPLDVGLSGVRVTMNATGSALAVSGLRGPAVLARVEGGTVVRSAEHHGDSGMIGGLSFAPVGDALALCSADGTVRLIDSTTGVASDTIRLGNGIELSGLEWSPGAERLAVSTRGGEVILLRTSPLSVEGRHRVSEAQLRCLAFSRDGRTLFCAGDSGRIIRVNLDSMTTTQSDRISEHSLFTIAVDASDEIIFVGTRDGRVVAIDAPTLEELGAFETGGSVMHLVSGVKPRTLFVSSLDQPIERWDFDVLAGTFSGIRP